MFESTVRFDDLLGVYDPPDIGIEEPAVIGRTTAAWPAVHEDDGLAVAFAALFVVQCVKRGHLQSAGVERFDRWVEFGHS